MNQNKNQTENQPKQADQLKKAELELFKKIKELTYKTEKEAKQIGIEFSEQGFSKKEMRKIVTAVTFDHIKKDRERRKALDDYDPRETFLIDSVKATVYTQIDIED